jgi:transcriptional regulator with XRE-family HTH domain
MGSEHPTAMPLRDNPKPRPRAQDLDRRLGLKIRQRRILLGITQEQMAELVGVTYQQAHKYEKGINRISACRLITIAAALQWSIAEMLEGIDQPQPPDIRTKRQLQVAALFAQLDERRADAVAALVRALVEQAGDE